MDDIVIVEVIDSLENLSYSLRSILLCEPSLLADTVKQLSSRSQLCDDVVFVLKWYQLSCPRTDVPCCAHSRLEPIHESDDMGMLHLL